MAKDEDFQPEEASDGGAAVTSCVNGISGSSSSKSKKSLGKRSLASTSSSSSSSSQPSSSNYYNSHGGPVKVVGISSNTSTTPDIVNREEMVRIISKWLWEKGYR